MTAPRGKKYIAAADFLRVFAVGLVACFHIWQQSWLDPGFRVLGLRVDLQRIIRRGYMGVDLMLLLSGFLLYLPVARAARRGEPMPSVRDFYARRLRRIVPSYLAAILIALGFTFVYGPDWGSAPRALDLLAHLTFTHTFWRGTYIWTSLNVGLWTLAVEMQFYLLFPWIARRFRESPWLTFCVMTAAGLLCRLTIARLDDVTMLFNQLPCMLDLYALGMLSAHFLSIREEKGGHWLSVPGAAACLAGILWVLWIQNTRDNRDLNQWQMIWRFPLGALGAGFLFCGGLWPKWLDRAAGNPLTKYCAAISYNFYIWHQYLAVKLKQWNLPAYVTEMPQRDEGRAWQGRYTLLCFAVAFAAATLFTYLLEKPAARWLAGPENNRFAAARRERSKL